ncbi:MAG: M50 family metallopeptidase [Armatimonadota bacterium]
MTSLWSTVTGLPFWDAVFSFAVTFAILVIVHELGHYLAARFHRMPVEEFAVGFGRKVAVLMRRGTTEYTLRALPLGGFVRVRGMEFENEADPVEGEDGFNRRPVHQRFGVIVAGPLASLLLGYLAFVVLFMVFGTPTGRVRLETVVAGKPAERAGLRAGDVVVAVNGESVDPMAMVTAIERSPGKAVRLEIERSGARQMVEVVPDAVPSGKESVGKIGVGPGTEMRPSGLGAAAREALRATGRYFSMLGNIVRSGRAKEAVGGPVGIARTFYDTAGSGMETRLQLMGSLSLSLFLFNVLPIPVLDGGQMMLLIVEAIRRRKLSADTMHRVHAAGLAVIGTLFVLVMFNDLTRWAGRH